MKKIINGLFAVLVVLTACNEEREIGKPEVERGAFSISFSTQEIDTKAIDDAANGYENTTTEELTVNTCYIGVFEVNGGKKILAEEIASTDERFVSGEAGKFSIKNFLLPIKKELSVVAIANPKENYTTIDNFADLVKKSHIYTEQELGIAPNYTFAPSSLVKVGMKEGITLNTTDDRIGTIELRQLAAKIRLKLTVDLPKMETSEETTDWNLDGWSMQDIVNQISKFANSSTSEKEGKLILVKKNKRGLEAAYWNKTSWLKDNSVVAEAYQCSKKECSTAPDTQQKYIHLTGPNGAAVTMTKVKTTPTYLFDLKSLQVLNVETGSKVVLFSENSANSLHKLWNSVARAVNKGSKEIDLTFYTYEKPVYGSDLSKALTVIVKGNVALGNILETVTYKLRGGALHPVWDIPSGWGNGMNTKFHIPDDQLTVDADTPPTTEEKLIADEGAIYTYNVVINPTKSKDGVDGILSGYYYDVKGKLKQSIDIQAELEYSVNVWNKFAPIDIPGFE